MTPPLFLQSLPAAGLVAVGDEVLLVGEEGRHAAKVLRLDVGEKLQIADGTGTVLRCSVSARRPESLTCRVESVTLVAPQPLRLVVVQALCKGDRGEAAVEMMTELGVDEVVPWSASRSIVQWHGARGEKAQQKWASTARTATKQSRRPFLPYIASLASSKQVAAVLAEADLALVLHESATAGLSSLPMPSDGTLVLVVGPEGGISDDELDIFTDAGARAVRLGREVLRTSTAGPAALAALCVRTGRW